MKFKFYALWLCFICVIVFLLQAFVNGFTELLLLDKSSYVEIWRFLTSIFLHGSIQHLLYNIFALALFGSILESLIGGRRFLIVFFITGILANVTAVNFYDSSLGASGAIFGVIGALIVVKPKMMVWAFGLPMPMFVAGILWAAGDVIGVFVPSNVGNIAHLAGMLFGLIFGALFRKLIYSNGYDGTIRSNRIDLDERSARDWEDKYL